MLLESFSRRTLDALPLRVALPFLSPLIALNVAKEAAKDAAVIDCAAAALTRGEAPTAAMVHDLLEKSKVIDREFLSRARGYPVAIAIRYADVAPPRSMRIERLLFGAYRVLAACREGHGIRTAIRAVYGELEFERDLRGNLELYAKEVHALSRSVRLPSLLMLLREQLASTLQRALQIASRGVAADAAHMIFRGSSRA
jgi:hypothetical protein